MKYPNYSTANTDHPCATSRVDRRAARSGCRFAGDFTRVLIAIIAGLAASLVLAPITAPTAFASPAGATSRVPAPQCYGGGFGGFGYCDGPWYADGSYDHMVTAMGGWQISRVCPPAADNAAIPLPWPGPGPNGHC
jgi:hypothetical protein